VKKSVISGDISRVPADAIITAINSGRMWFGGIDGVIQRLAGDQFHSQAAAALPLDHGQTVFARGNGSQLPFKNVIFVIDDLCGPLSEIIFNGLVAASNAGLRSVTLPTIRMGVMLGTVEKTPEEALGQMASGVRRFQKEHPESSITDLTFVVYNDESIKIALERALTS